MKLTEQQLAQMFKANKAADNTMIEDDFLYDSADASESRMAHVEKIADDSKLSASYQIINQLDDWSSAIATDIQLSFKPRFYDQLMAWMKPSLATAAMLTAVYFISPELDNEVQISPQSDNIMFTSNFDSNSDVINEVSFDKKTSGVKSDSISSIDFS